MTADALLIKKIERLKEDIAVHDRLYYQESAPRITDSEYDDLKRQLLSLLRENDAELRRLGYSTDYSNVGYGVNLKHFKVIQHLRPMLSLDNAFTMLDVQNFINRASKILSVQQVSAALAEQMTFVCQQKIDGVSFSAVYEHGRLQYAVTRGDGKQGENITNNFLTIVDVPKRIALQKKIEVRGEIYIEKDDFIRLNEYNAANDLKTFANPRNAASGSIRQLDSEITRQRPLRYKVWEAEIEDDVEIRTYFDIMTIIQSLNFNVVDSTLVNGIEGIEEYYLELEKRRSALPYDIDGAVYKINDLKQQAILAHTNSSPRWAIAHKFSSETAETKLINIVVQISRHGLLTPVAELEPINIGGALISKATLHKFDEIERNNFKIGDVIEIKRAGDVIPKIVAVVQHTDGERYLPPQFCPSCNSKVERFDGGAFYYCVNKEGCEEQIIQRLSHFVSKQCMNIEKLGEKQIRSLYALGIIRDAVDIMLLPTREKEIDELKNIKGWGDKSVSDMIASIRKAKIVPLSNFIHALNIKHVGAVAAAKIAQKFITFDAVFADALSDITAEKKEIYAVHGLGEKICESIVDYMCSNRNDVLKLLGAVNIAKDDIAKESDVTNLQFFNKNIAITGTLTSMTRDEAIRTVQRLGGVIKSGVTKKLDILIAGEGAGQKLILAEQLNVQIMSESAFLDVIKDDAQRTL